jgi:CBS domain-containing protein
MNITDYILKEIQPLTTKSNVKMAQRLFQEHPITHLHLVEEGTLLGSFSESDIQTLENSETSLESYTSLLDWFFAEESSTVLELLQLFANNDCTILPVLNTNKKYIGYYDLSDVLDVFTSSPFMLEESEILVVETQENNFSMSTIAQIVEASGCKLLGAYISEKKEGQVQVTLKIVAQEINEIIQTFRRYDYTIVSVHENDVYLDDLKNRSQYLQKYLNM